MFPFWNPQGSPVILVDPCSQAEGYGALAVGEARLQSQIWRGLRPQFWALKTQAFKGTCHGQPCVPICVGAGHECFQGVSRGPQNVAPWRAQKRVHVGGPFLGPGYCGHVQWPQKGVQIVDPDLGPRTSRKMCFFCFFCWCCSFLRVSGKHKYQL